MKKVQMVVVGGLVALSWSVAQAQTGSSAGARAGIDTDSGAAGAAASTGGARAGVGVNSDVNGDASTGGVTPTVDTHVNVNGDMDSDANSAAPSAAVQPLPSAQPGSGTYESNNNIENRGRRYMSAVGAALLVGGGFEDFTSSNLRDMTGGGGAWTARAVAGTRQYVGLEAAYVGAARSINALGLGNNAALVSNGVEGALRVNVPVGMGRSLIEPFGFVGLGWQHYSLTNAGTNTSDVSGSDDIMTLPLGGGVEYAYRWFIADARFTYRQTYLNDLMRTGGGNLNNWGVGAQVGASF